MTDNLRRYLLPAYLFFCLVLGGSSQSIWGVLALRLVAIALIAWAAVGREQRDVRRDRFPIALLICGLALIVAQLVPLPPSVWTNFPRRELLVQGFAGLGEPLPWQPVSLTPFLSLETFLFLLPPIATFLTVRRLREKGVTAAAVALLAGALANIFLGYLQLATGASSTSRWYLYDQTNPGSAVGFFANHNHMGLLLVVALPFLAVLALQSLRSSSTSRLPVTVFAGVTGLAIVVGIALNGSMAAVLLSVPVILATATLGPRVSRFRAALLGIAAMALLGATIFLSTSPVQPKIAGENVSSFESRQEIWGTTWSSIESSFPVGTGFGSFEKVYTTAEPLGSVTATYVNHAHNDYLELLLEGGLPMGLLIVAFFSWWAVRSVRIFASPFRDGLRRAAAISSGAILAHSVVDYPLRTTAIATVFAFCVALLCSGSGQRSRHGESGVRHLTIG